MTVLTGGSLEFTFEAGGNELVTPKVTVQNAYDVQAIKDVNKQHLMGEYMSSVRAGYRVLAHGIANDMGAVSYDELVQKVENGMYEPDKQLAGGHWEKTVVLPCWTPDELRDYLIDHISWPDRQDDWITYVSPLAQQGRPELMDLDKETMWDYLQRVFQRDPVRAVRMTPDEVGSVVYDDLMADGMLRKRKEE